MQLCHGYSGPFLDVARQYAALFRDTPFKILTVYLTGTPSQQVTDGSASDEVICLNFSSHEIRGLKLSAIARLKEITASRDFSMVIAHRPKPIYIACLATRLPVIGVHHGFGDYERLHRRWFANLFRKRLVLLGVSNAVRDEIRMHLNWPYERIETLYNRLDVDSVIAQHVPRDTARIHLGLPQDAVVIANVGRLHSDKDQTTLLKGFASAITRLPPGSLLVIIGSGPLEKQLKELTKRLDISESVKFLGQVPEARRYFTAFDIFVLTSDHEPFGMVLLEAMAAGVPVLATDCGGAPEVVGNPEQLFSLGNQEQLTTLLLEMINEPDRKNTLRRKSDAAYERLQFNFTDNIARKVFFNFMRLQNFI